MFDKSAAPHPLHRLTDFPEAPPELIAQNPLAKRDEARLMTLSRQDGSIAHRVFSDVEALMAPGDLLVLNDVKVFPARLLGRKGSGGLVKFLLLRRLEANAAGERWASLLTPPVRIGAVLAVEDGLTATVEKVRADGEFEVTFSRPILYDLERLGRMPLPPYIRREVDAAPGQHAADRRYYQTVYAHEETPPENPGEAWTPGAVAAPTAGLHFTEELLHRLNAKGVETAYVTLKVGWGTFRPFRDADYREHKMLPEEFSVPEATADAVKRLRERGKRLWAVGTTAVRTLETQAEENGLVRPGKGETSLYIYPGHKFRAVDALITNFHLPGHTPLLLAAAFAGTDALRTSYETAVREGYRFFSYGDAMAIV